MKLDFETAYRPHKRLYSDHGDPEVIDYAPEYDKFGNWQLVETGRHSLYDEIQSHKDSCDINLLVKRFANGEVDVLERVQGVYGDFSDVPTNFAALLNQVEQAKQTFEGLPVDVKEKFGQNFVSWMQEFGSDEWNTKMGFVASSPETLESDVKSEVNADE